jgi:hypothetical protein
MSVQAIRQPQNTPNSGIDEIKPLAAKYGLLRKQL